MKKFLIIMLSVLLLLSFTSCEKDKSGDVIAAFEKFANEKETAYRVYTLFSSVNESDITTEDVGESSLGNLLAAYYDEDSEPIQQGTITVTAASGSVTSEGEVSSGKKVSFQNVTFSCKEYRDSKEYRSTDFVISGSCEYKSEPVRAAGASIINYSSDVTVNGKNYKLSYTWNDGTEKYSAASVDGTDVELRLLNAGK